MSTLNKEIYNQKAACYEKKWEAYLRHTHLKFLARIDTSEDEAILDLSCGTGLLAKELKSEGFPFKKLVLNDPSEKMLAIARTRLESSDKISFTNYSVEHLDFEEEQFDRIFCLNAFHFYSLQQQILHKVHALLKPGGHFYVLDWNRSGFFRFINRIIDWNTSEHIETKSLGEFEKMLVNSNLFTSSKQEWYWRYWKFFFTEAIKRR